MDIGTISLIVVLGLIVLLAIGMPLGLASAAIGLLVLVLKFEPSVLMNPMTFGDGMLTGRPGTGALYLLAQKMFDLAAQYVLLSVPLFIFMAALLERSGIAKEMYNSLAVWLSKVRGGIAVVTSIMAVIMAAMSGIIGGEVVLLGLIALPQMLRLGYNQNLAIGTICASGSLGTMIPPSVVLIIYGLITETSIKALFTGAFVPGFMLASFIIIYIVARTQITPSLAPLPADSGIEVEEFDHYGTSKIVTGYLGLFAGLAAIQMVGVSTGLMEGGIFGALVMLIFAAIFFWASFGAKGTLFMSFIHIMGAGFCGALLLRVLYFTLTGQNAPVEGEDPIVLGTPDFIWKFAVAIAFFLAMLFIGFGRERAVKSWKMGKGLVPPLIVIGAVLGSIYGGITGITEAAGMGAFAVFIIALFRGEASVGLIWDSLMRTLKSTGTILWVTIGAAALAGAYTVAGGPTYIANMIVGSEMPTMMIILLMMVILLFMGAFMDWVGIVLLIIPVFLPIVQRLPIEEIGFIGQLEPKWVSVWFGVLFCMNMQVSFLSPPFGPAAFYLKSVAPPHISLTDIFKGFLPFICVQLCGLAVLLIWPSIVTILL